MNGAESSADEASFPGFIPVRLPIDVTAARRFLAGLNISNFDSDNVRVLQANNGMSNPTYLFILERNRAARERSLSGKSRRANFCPGHIRLIESSE